MGWQHSCVQNTDGPKPMSYITERDTVDGVKMYRWLSWVSTWALNDETASSVTTLCCKFSKGTKTFGVMSPKIVVREYFQ